MSYCADPAFPVNRRGGTCLTRAPKRQNPAGRVVSASMSKKRSESERIEVTGRRRTEKKKASCAWEYGKGERWENRTRGGGDCGSKIEELPSGHSSIMSL